MKRLCALLAFLAACLISASAPAAEVCGYSISRANGFRCPPHRTVCLSASTLTGPCDVPLRCFGGSGGFFCDATLTPTSGPAAQCPVSSQRLLGFRCVPQVVSPPPARCGNGVVDSGEECDPPGSLCADGSACSECLCVVRGPGQVEHPSIDTPAPRVRTACDVDPNALPADARAHLPAYDGDQIFVTLPPRQQDPVRADEVRSAVIEPILNALGGCFRRGLAALATPPQDGIPQPVANFDGLAQAVAYEYANNPALLRPRTQHMIDVFLGTVPPDDEIDNALETGEGMNFAQYVAGLERLEIAYPFQQVYRNVPIEHTLLLASRWEGQNVTTVRGTLLNNFAIANQRLLRSARAVTTAISALAAVPHIDRVTSTAAEDGPFLVLLPYGTDANGTFQLRYAYRMILRAVSFGEEGPFLLWLDARSGTILKLESLSKNVSASGAVYNRDPGVGTTTTFLEVDPASGGQYTLKLAGVSGRVDFQGDGFNASDVSVSDSSGGSSSTFANFDQATINDAAQALCGSGTNKGFQQVNFFATLHRYYSLVLSQGIFTPFPTSPWSPKVESASAGCNAWSNMDYGACAGYTDPACPNFSDGTTGANNFMNFSHDNPVIGHELAHNITPRLTNGRPSDWCAMPTCSVPLGWSKFHDLADFWADHLENTNCTGGWVGKNINGVNASLNCLLHDEGGYLPRLHEVTVPFNPGSPGDHFPEHRSGGFNTCNYDDGQIGAAALWQVRLGMRSKCRPSGVPQFGVRFQRALKETGFLSFTPACTDTGIYQHLYDLEKEMVDQWATSGSPGGAPAFAHNGPHSTNKVTAGFARAGIFLIPFACLDGGTPCPSGENGADAVIDIDDNTTGDDLTVNGVTLPEVDFLLLSAPEFPSPAPTFHVWTGPRYKLDGPSGAMTLTNPSPCNAKFTVEVSDDPTFPAATTIVSPSITVDTDPTTPMSPECYGTWTPSADEWDTLQTGGAGTRIYYRARTRDAADGNERLSTMPGNGLWTVPPPYAVLTDNGQSDY